MPRRTESQIYDDIELADSVLQDPNNAGKPMKGIHERKASLFLELEKRRDEKVRGRYDSDMEFIEQTKGVIAGLKLQGKSAKQMESNLKELEHNLEVRREKQRRHASKWRDSNKDASYEYMVKWRDKNRIAYNDYMRSYRERKRAEKTL